MSEFQKGYHRDQELSDSESETEVKSRVISSNDDRSSLAVYAEHSPALEPRCDGFSVYRKGWSCQNQVVFVLLMLCCESLNVWTNRVTPDIHYITALKGIVVSCYLLDRDLYSSVYRGSALRLRLQFRILLHLLVQTACLHECGFC